MQIFEFHFNPGTKEEIAFDSFIYEPENIYEKRLGNLYMVGELKNILPSNSQFLNNLASTIKKEYYLNLQKSPEQTLRDALRKANQFLDGLIEEGNVDWLGNLNFIALTVENFVLNFTKIGNLEILLLREGEILNISQVPEQDIESYSLKIFENIITGRLAAGDKIVILTKDIYEFFKNENLLKKLSLVYGEKEIKKIFKTKEKDLQELSGICFLVVMSEEEKSKQTLTFQKKPIPLFKIDLPVSLRKALQAGKESIRQALSSFLITLRKINLIPFLKKIRAPLSPKITFSTPKIEIPEIQTHRLKKNIILITALVLILFLGFFIFKREKEREKELIQANLEQIQEKITRAEGFLILKDERQSNLLFQEAWNEILPLAKQKTLLKDEISTLKGSIEKQLETLNKIQRIDEPEIYSGALPEQEQFKELNLKELPADFKVDLACSFHSNLYFLDKKTGKIIKYPYLKDSKWGAPRTWLKSSERTVQAKDMAIDGNIWILNKDNAIDRYYAGIYQETLNFNFYPKLEYPTKIFTNFQLPYLYILEPQKNRIIIVDKTGEIIKQFQSDKFDNLKDFVVSEDGETIYLLNGPKIFQISFEQ